jgi:hypothetical protein
MSTQMDPRRHDFMGPAPALVAGGLDPDVCGECGEPRDAHTR